jgi:oxygen-dependent protoporphyrinogen oxidase
MRAAVVGAGLGGLSAAIRLQQAGHDVVVFDPEPGGKARTMEPMPGWKIEWGPHSFTGRAEGVFALADAVGVRDQVIPLGAAAKARFLVRDGQLRKAPMGALRLSEWWGLLRGLFRRVADVPGESVRDWIARRLGDAFADGPADALLTGIWATDPREIDMDVGFPNLARAVREAGSIWSARTRFGKGASGTWGFADGMGVLTSAARSKLDVRAVAVRSMAPASKGWTLTLDGGQDTFDAVILAAEAPACARLLPIPALDEIRYAPMAVAHWMSPDAAFPVGFGFLAANSERRPVLGTIFVSDLFPTRAPTGMRSFATMIGGARHPEDATIEEAEARSRVAAEHRALTGKDVQFSGFHLVRHVAAVAPPRLGHADRLARVRVALPPGVDVAGAWVAGGAMDDAVRAGFDAADRTSGAANV